MVHCQSTHKAGQLDRPHDMAAGIIMAQPPQGRAATLTRAQHMFRLYELIAHSFATAAPPTCARAGSPPHRAKARPQRPLEYVRNTVYLQKAVHGFRLIQLYTLNSGNIGLSH